MTLHDVQCHLDNQGVSTLIVDIVIKCAMMPKIFSEIVELGNALLEGGNQEIQKSLFTQLHSGEVSQSFFKVFYDKMSDAQTEIKSTVTVNTSDINARATDDKEPNKDIDKALKRRGCKINGMDSNDQWFKYFNHFPVRHVNGIVWTDELREQLDQAALATQQAYVAARGGAPGLKENSHTFTPSKTP